MRKRIRKIGSSAFSLLLAAVMLVAGLPVVVASAQTTTPDYIFDKAADPEHYSSFVSEASTLYDGYLWTNKDVSDTNMEYLLPDGDPNNILTAPANQLIASLSAMGQAYPIEQESEIKKEANIVMVMDLSTSMKNAIGNNDSTNRLTLMKSVAQEFIDSLVNIVNTRGNSIKFSLVTYAGVGTTNVGWTEISTSVATSIKKTIGNFTLGNLKDNTNCQAGLFLAKLLYSDKFAPANVNDENTNNFVLFMSDGAPNRSYEKEDVPYTVDSTGTRPSTSDGNSTVITRKICNTDYRYLSAYRTLKEIDDISSVENRNMTFFSLGLGEWFKTDASESTFPTAPNLLQLCAAVGNKQISLTEAETYLGEDVPDGLMPSFSGDATYPVLTPENFITSKSDKRYSLRNANNQIVYYNSDFSVIQNYIENSSPWNTGDLEERKKDGIFSLPTALSARVRNYYAGNTAEKFEQSFSDITNAILLSFDNYLTEVMSDPDIDGNITFIDKLGDYMDVKDFKGLCFNGKLYNTSNIARLFSSSPGQAYEIFQNNENLTTKEVDDFLHAMSYHMGNTFTLRTLSNLIESCIAGGSIYYNSEADFNFNLKIYASYYDTAEENHLYMYKGNYYSADGSVNPPPEGANCVLDFYTIAQTVSPDGIIGDENKTLSMVDISVITMLEGNFQQYVRFSIPASLLPVKQVAVKEDGTAYEATSTFPMSCVYTIGLRDDFYKIRDDYPYYDSDGNPIFYSNAWDTSESEDNTHVYYNVNKTNPFYFTLEDEPIYVYDEATSSYVAATRETAYNEHHYILTEYNDVNGFHEEYTDLKNVYATTNDYIIQLDENGEYQLKAGSICTWFAVDSLVLKPQNTTSSVAYSHYAKFFGHNGKLKVIAYLGNNGTLEVPTTEITVKKYWKDGAENHSDDTAEIHMVALAEQSTTTSSIDEFTVNAACNWSYTFTGLIACYGDGSLINYFVEEDVKPGYAPKYSQPVWDPETKTWTIGTVENIPVVAQYEYYLADGSGNPIDASGNIVEWADRVIVQEPVSQGISDGTYTTFAASQLMDGTWSALYTPLDVTASYSVIASTQPDGGSFTSNGLGTHVEKLSEGYRDSLVSFAVTPATINPDSVVIDYGKPILIDVLSNDKSTLNPTSTISLDALGNALDDGVSAGTTLTKELSFSGESATTGSLATANGSAKIVSQNNEQLVEYKLGKYLSSIERFYYAVNVDDAGYRYQKVSVIPATTVYYEDNFSNTTDSDMTNGIVYTGSWTTVGTETGGYQDSGLIGAGNTPYGYDSSYANDSTYSNGSAVSITGTKTTVNGKVVYDATASFTFTGTGFDIISRTDPDCGLVVAQITDSNGVTKKVSVINKGVNTLYQIPVISYTGIPYGTYSVTLTVSPGSAMLGTGGMFYLDGIVIYDPLGTSADDSADYSEGFDAYDADSEGRTSVTSFRNVLIDSTSLDSTLVNGVVWIDTADAEFTAGGNLEPGDIKNYSSFGPNEEVYLTEGNAIGFVLESKELPTTVQVSAKTVNAPAMMAVKTAGNNESIYQHALATATEMYYDVTSGVVFTPTTDDLGETVYRATVVIANVAAPDALGILSLVNLKLTYSDNVPLFANNFSLSSSKEIFTNVMSVAYYQCASAEENYDFTAISSQNTVDYGDALSLSLATSQFVHDIAVFDENNMMVAPLSISSKLDIDKIYSSDRDKAKTWYVSLPTGSTGTHNYTIKAVDAAGQIFKDGFNISINVKRDADALIIDCNSMSLNLGSEVSIGASVYPLDSTSKVVWSSSDSGIVTVDSKGNAKAVGIGTATITVSTDNGQYSASCKITVKESFINWLYRIILRFFGISI